MPSIVQVTDPLRPQAARHHQIADGTSLRDWMGQHGLEEFPAPTICLLGGQPLLRARWGVSLHGDQSAVLVPLPAGGDGSNPLQAILLIGLTAIAPWAAGFAGFGQFGTALLTGAIMVGGSLLINAILPPPKLPSPHALDAPSPTYSIQASGNIARLLQPIPCPFGRNRIMLDWAAAPWQEYRGNVQHLYQLFCVGQGEYDIEQILIGETDLAVFGGAIAYEVLGPDEVVTLFPDNVVTSADVAGQELQGPNEVALDDNFAFTAGTKHISGAGLDLYSPGQSIDVAGTAYNDGTYTVSAVAGDGSYLVTVEALTDEASVACTISLTSGGYIGPFQICAAGEVANFVAFDYQLSAGLFVANNDGGLDAATVELQEEVREIDDNGDPLGGWTVIAAPTITDATNTPQRLSHRYALPAQGRYEARVLRINNKSGSNRTSDRINWAGLRAYLPSQRTYGDVTLIAMTMKVEGNLASVGNHRVSVVCTRKLPIYDPATATWSPRTATRSPAWALAEACRSSYGGNQADSRIDLDALAVLAETWDERGDTFDFVFDQRLPLREMLTMIARVGRAVPIDQGGVITAVRDEPQAVYSTGFDMRNIKRGSLRIDRALASSETPDSVIVEFWDEETWSWNEVECVLPGGSSDNPERRKFPGISTWDHAWREGMYLAAVNRDQRTFPSFVTELEGLVPSFGAHVPLSHDLPQWGYSGELVSIDEDDVTLNTSERLVWTPATQHYVALTMPDGSIDGPYPVSQGGEFSMVLDGRLDWEPYAGGERQRCSYKFGPGDDKWAKICRVIGIVPRGGAEVEVLLVNAADSVHTSDQGEAPVPPSSSLLPTIPDAPIVAGLNVIPDPILMNVARVSWFPAAGAKSYLVQVSYDGGNNYVTIVDTPDNSVSVLVPTGTLYVRVAAIGKSQGLYATWSGEVGTVGYPPGALTGLALQQAFTGVYCKIQWNANPLATYYVVEVWADYGSGEAKVREVTVTDTTFTYSLDDAIEDGGPDPDIRFVVYAGNTNGTGDSAELEVSNSAPAAPSGINTTPGEESITVDWSDNSEIDLAGYRLWMSTVDGFTPGPSNLIYEGLVSGRTENGLIAGTTYYFVLASYDMWGNETQGNQFSEVPDSAGGG